MVHNSLVLSAMPLISVDCSGITCKSRGIYRHLYTEYVFGERSLVTFGGKTKLDSIVRDCR